MAKKKQIDTTQQSGQVVDLEAEQNSEQEKKKKKRKIKFKIFMYLLLFAFIGCAVASYLFNWYGIRQRIVNVLVVGDQQYMVKMTELENEKTKAKGEQRLAEEAKAAYEGQLNALMQREKAIADKEKQVEDRLKAVIYSTNNGEDARKNVISLFESMDAESAAKTMQSMNDVDAVASILGSMKQKPAAAIMEAFDTEFAALVAARMLI